MFILTWLSHLCHIHIIKVVTICSLPSIHILIPDISRIELHIDLTELLLPINIILVHLCDTTHASVTISIYISRSCLVVSLIRYPDIIKPPNNKISTDIFRQYTRKQYVQAIMKATDLQRLPADVKAAAPLS